MTRHASLPTTWTDASPTNAFVEPSPRLASKGPVYELFAQELAAYGLAVCGAWLLTGEMFRQCASRGYRIGSQPHDWNEHDRTSLADETVVQALKDFRDKGLERGGWRPDGGASMKTYFVTACVYAFLNAYRRWHRERARFRTCSPFDPADLELFDTRTNEDIAEYALVKVQVNEACSDKTDYQQAVLVLRGLDYTHAEIGEVLGKNASAVERLLGRMRNTAIRNGASEGRTQRD